MHMTPLKRNPLGKDHPAVNQPVKGFRRNNTDSLVGSNVIASKRLRSRFWSLIQLNQNMITI